MMNTSRPRDIKIWKIESDSPDHGKLDSQILRFSGDVGVIGLRRLSRAEIALWERYGFTEGDRRPIEPPSPPLVLRLPAASGFDLDFVSYNPHICSARLRAALGLPPEVVQYLPLVIDSPDPQVRAADYQLMRILPSQPTIDMGRSDAKFEIKEDRHVGGSYIGPDGLDIRYILLDGLVPRTELFRALESPLRSYATDSLAERVVKAGIRGIAFTDPEWSYWRDRHPPLIRTANGVEPRSPATRRAHLRLAKRVRAQEAASRA